MHESPQCAVSQREWIRAHAFNAARVDSLSNPDTVVIWDIWLILLERFLRRMSSCLHFQPCFAEWRPTVWVPRRARCSALRELFVFHAPQAQPSTSAFHLESSCRNKNNAILDFPLHELVVQLLIMKLCQSPTYVTWVSPTHQQADSESALEMALLNV